MEINAVQKQHEAFEMVYLNPKGLQFLYDGENLTLSDGEGNFYPRVTLRRSFPLSAQNTNVLVRIPDNENESGPEIGILADVDALEENSKQAVLRELQLHYFVPVIQQINSIREEFGFLYWSAKTDRGGKEFIMRDSIIGAVRRISEGRWLIIDINQTRYEVRDINALDVHSQKLIRRYLLL
jgi:hypothetical protein